MKRLSSTIICGILFLSVYPVHAQSTEGENEEASEGVSTEASMDSIETVEMTPHMQCLKDLGLTEDDLKQPVRLSSHRRCLINLKYRTQAIQKGSQREIRRQENRKMLSKRFLEQQQRRSEGLVRKTNRGLSQKDLTIFKKGKKTHTSIRAERRDERMMKRRIEDKKQLKKSRQKDDRRGLVRQARQECVAESYFEKKKCIRERIRELRSESQ